MDDVVGVLREIRDELRLGRDPQAAQGESGPVWCVYHTQDGPGVSMCFGCISPVRLGGIGFLKAVDLHGVVTYYAPGQVLQILPGSEESVRQRAADFGIIPSAPSPVSSNR